MFYCVYVGNSKVSNTDKFQLSLGEKMFLLNKIVCQMHIYMYLTIKNFHSIFCIFVLSGAALSVKFSISWSEISANSRDAIVSFFPQGDSCQSYTGSFVIGQNR